MVESQWAAEVILLLISPLIRNVNNCRKILIVGICQGRLFHMLLHAILVYPRVFCTREVVTISMKDPTTSIKIVVLLVTTEVIEVSETDSVKMYLST